MWKPSVGARWIAIGVVGLSIAGFLAAFRSDVDSTSSPTSGALAEGESTPAPPALAKIARVGGESREPVSPTPVLESLPTLPARDRLTLQVAVEDEAGAPVAGLEVVLRRLGEGADTARVRTDSEGAASFDELIAGTYLVEVRRDGEPVGSRVVRLRSGAHDVLRLVVRDRGPRLFGRITDLRGGATVDVVLSLHRKGSDATGGPVASAAPGPAGDYRTPPLVPGEYRLDVGRGDALRRLDRRDVRLGADDLRLDLILTGGVEVTGRVCDEAGNPLAASVLLYRPGSAGAPVEIHRTRTAPADGTYRFEAIEPGPFRATVAADGHATRRERADVPAGGTRGLDWALAVGGSITGRVVDELGRALACEVEAFLLLRDGEVPIPGSARAAADGRFEFVGLPFGRYEVRALPEARAWAVRSDVVIAPGSPRADVPITVTPGASLVGSLRSTGGAPPPTRITMKLESTALGWRVLAVPIDPDGRFRLDHVPPAHLDLEARLGERSIARRDVPFREGEETTWSLTFDP